MRLVLNSVDVYGPFVKSWEGSDKAVLYAKAYAYLEVMVGDSSSFYKDLELYE